MSKRKSIRYTVRTTREIAREMCRYEGGTIVGEVQVSSADTVARVIRLYGNGDVQSGLDSLVVYDIEIESSRVCLARWATFGVTPDGEDLNTILIKAITNT